MKPDDDPPAPYRPSPRRIGGVVLLVGLVLVALVGRVAYLQTKFAAQHAERVESQHEGGKSIVARRGGIFDRNGLMLAGTTLERNVFADPKFMHDEFEGSLLDLDFAVEKLADRLFADVDRVAMIIGGEPDKRYLPLAREVDAAEAEAAVDYAQSLGLRGVAVEPQPRRVYPMAQTAAHVLGTVGRDEQGLEGLERRLDETLSGRDGRIVTLRDKRRRAIAAPIDGYQPPRHGSGLVLTIDARIQQIAEEELAATCDAFGAVGASVVVLDPHTGDVLALANVPTYHPQFPGDAPVAARRNRAVVDPYEPGSVVKPFLMAGLLEAGVTKVDEVLETGKTVRLPVGRRVTDDYGYEKLSVWDFVVKSSNIGMATMNDRVSYDRTVAIYKRFGFGEKTGVGLDAEHAGLIYKSPPDKYTQSSMSFGYAMMATPIQLARGVAAFANGGKLVQPRLVAGFVGEGGQVEATPSTTPEVEATTPAIADQMRRIMADVFVRGTARHARSDKYNLWGKTGTAHQSEGGRQSEEKYFASFVGGAPYEHPRLVIAVTVDEPTKERGYHGGQVAGGTAARVLERSLEVLGVPHSPPLAEPPEFVREVLHNYARRFYDPERTLRDDPRQETTQALEAEEAADMTD